MIKIFYFLSLITIISSESYPSFSNNNQKQQPSQKVIIRSKRQQCVCIAIIFPMNNRISSNSNFQCSCDSQGKPIEYVQQQQELQKELAHMQQTSTQDSQCGCQLNPSATTSAPIIPHWSNFHQYSNNYDREYGSTSISKSKPTFDCFCIHLNNTNPPSSPYSSVYPQNHEYSGKDLFFQQSLTTTTPSPIRTSISDMKTASQKIPKCKCFEIIVKFSSERQFQCDCGKGPAIMNQHLVEKIQQQQQQQHSQGAFDPYVQSGMAAGVIPHQQQNDGIVQPQFFNPTTTASPPIMTANHFPVTTSSQVAEGNAYEPDTVPCVMIQIRTGARVCACQENYKQCTEHICCHVKKYRSYNNDKTLAISPATATVDLLVDLLQKVRESLI